MEFLASWLWLIFIIVGVVMATLELIVGINTGLDLVVIGSTFIIGGFVGWIFHSWVLVLIITGIICVVYLAIGRRYVHRWTAVAKEKTNIDAIIGSSGIVIKNITDNTDGLVKVGKEEWRARSDEYIEAGEEIIVRSISGVTLAVTKKRG
jgi:membrane protein implicated in regulation of membrane protease activity